MTDRMFFRDAAVLMEFRRTTATSKNKNRQAFNHARVRAPATEQDVPVIAFDALHAYPTCARYEQRRNKVHSNPVSAVSCFGLDTMDIAMRCPIRFDSDSARKVPDSIRFVRDFTAADSMRFDSCSILQHPIRSDSIQHRKHGCPIRCDSIRSCLSPDSICVCVVTSRRRFDSIRFVARWSIRFDSFAFFMICWCGQSGDKWG